MKKAIVIKKGDKNDHRIRVKVRGDSGFEVVRDDIPGLKCDLHCEDTCNAILTVMHSPWTGWHLPGQIWSLGGGLTFGGVHPFTIGTGQQPMTSGGVHPVGVGTNQPPMPGGATGPHSPTPGGAVHTSAHTVPGGAPYPCTSELNIHVHVHVHSN